MDALAALLPECDPGFHPGYACWTASDRRGKGNEGEAYVLSFGRKGTGGDAKNEPHFVRLVRVVAQ